MQISNPTSSSWDTVGQAAAIGLAFAIPVSTALTTILVSIILLSWLLGPNHTLKRTVLFFHPVMSWIYPLVLFTLLGITYSIGESGDVVERLMDTMRLGLIPLLLYFYQSPKIAKFALWAFILAMVITLILAYLKVYAGFPIGLKYTTGAVFKSHIKTSFFMAIAAFFLALHIKQTQKYRWVLGLTVIAMIYYLIFMSVGRIGYITLTLCLLFLAWHWYRLKGVLLAFMLAVAMFTSAYFTSDVFSGRVNLLSRDLDYYHQGGRLVESSLGSRIEFAQLSANLIAQHPLFGWGTGSFSTIYEQKYHDKNTLLTSNPHNEYLLISTELGLIGLGLLLLMFYQQWRLSFHLPLSYRTQYQGVMLTFIVGCLLNSWLSDSSEGYFYCVITAVCFASLPQPSLLSRAKASLH